MFRAEGFIVCPGFFEPQEAAAMKEHVRQFQAELIEVAEEIDELNERRQRAPGGRRFVAFNPRLFETSVSI